MERLAPAGPVYQAGTLSGNPVAVAAGLAALELLDRLQPYERLRALAERLSSGLADAFVQARLPVVVNRVESLFSVFFSEQPVRRYDEARAADHERYATFFHAMLDRGIYLPPSGYEGWFIGVAHTDDDVDRTIRAAEEAAALV
jgi:glutamate-1-semialdehyde 2,1-aminomutase